MQLMNNLPCNDDKVDAELSVSFARLQQFGRLSSFQDTAFLSSLRRMTQAVLR